MQRSTVISRALIAIALAAGVGATGVATASAAAADAVSIKATVTCDSETNLHVITWTVTNLTQGQIDTRGGNITDVRLTAGHSLDSFIRFFPGSMPAAGDTAVGTSRADGNALGVIDLSLNLFVTSIDSFGQATASVTLTDVCGAVAPAPAPVPAPTTTTIPPTTTTAAASEAPVVTAVAAADGTLPHTGGNTALALPALLTLMFGMALTIMARRPKLTSAVVRAARVGRTS